MKNKRILISGAGIAGLTLAYWLRRWGFEPTVIERYPRIREGGYLIDFFGLGVDVAEKMGVLSEIKRQEIRMQELVFVDGNGKRKGGLSISKMGALLGNKAFNLLRSDLSKILFLEIEDHVKFIFDTSITAIEQLQKGVNVTLDNGQTELFDLVVGADGLHSNTRALAFGAESKFVTYYGYYVASYTINNYLHQQESFLSHTVPGKQVAIYSVPGNKLAALFLFASSKRLLHDGLNHVAAKRVLHETFANMKWECPNILSRANEASDFYFDEVSQVQMRPWSADRVTLVGDACDCPSLLSGQGSTLAMVGAYILAGELWRADGDHIKAFAEYEQLFRPFIERKQRTAQSFAGAFLPKNELSLWARNTFSNLLFVPIVSRWFVKKFLTDDLQLKIYGG